MELTRRDLTRVLGGILGISLAGCTTTQPTTKNDNTHTNTMNIKHDSQTFETKLSAVNLDETEVNRFVDEEYDNILYVIATSAGWAFRVVDDSPEA